MNNKREQNRKKTMGKHNGKKKEEKKLNENEKEETLPCRCIVMVGQPKVIIFLFSCI